MHTQLTNKSPTIIPYTGETFYYFLDYLENRKVRIGTQRKITILCDPPRPLRLIFFAMIHIDPE